MSLTAPADLNGGPPKKDDLKLMAMPTEILDEILQFTLSGNTLLCISDANGQRKMYWHQSWVAGLFQVSKKFGACVRTVVSTEVVLHVNESERGKHMLETTPTDHEERDHILDLGPFPGYLQQKAMTMFVVQSKTHSLFAMDRLNLEAFPSLRLLTLNLGSLRSICEGLESQIIKGIVTNQAGPVTQKMSDFVWNLVLGTSAGKRTEAFELVNEGLNALSALPYTPETRRHFSETIFRAVACCVSSARESCERFLAYLAKTQLGITRQSFIGLNEKAVVMVDFVEEIDGATHKVSERPGPL